MAEDKNTKRISDDEFKEKLSDEQYQVMRQKGTEAPFTGKYWNEHGKGMYTCAACGTELFKSDVKFDSGTGWPSFSDAIPDSVVFHDDMSHGIRRTEVTCTHCGSHLGHIFDDLPRFVGKAGGPKDKGGKRYCINSVCLDLKSDQS